MQQLKDRHQGVPFEVYWVPGHKGVTGNEEADKLAKVAALKDSSAAHRLLNILRNELPHSKSAYKTMQLKAIRDSMQKLFQTSPMFNRFHKIDPKAPSSDYRKLVTDLPRRQMIILIQLRTGHAQLRRHLFKIGVEELPICPACHQAEETV
jgi:hypothetical protein